MAYLVVAQRHQPVEQLGELNRGPGARLVLQHVAEQGVEAGGAGGVGARLAQQAVAQADEGGIAGVGKGGDEEADELPPVAERRPGQRLERFGHVGGGGAQSGVFDHGDGREQFKGGFPEVMGGEVAFQGGLGVAGATVELGQRQGQPSLQGVGVGEVGGHGGDLAGSVASDEKYSRRR